jgi:hypothetical protein
MLLQESAEATARSAVCSQECCHITTVTGSHVSLLCRRYAARREVLKPQPDLLYEDKDGTAVFKDCIVGRWKEYKWYGCNNKVFR